MNKWVVFQSYEFSQLKNYKMASVEIGSSLKKNKHGTYSSSEYAKNIYS